MTDNYEVQLKNFDDITIVVSARNAREAKTKVKRLIKKTRLYDLDNNIIGNIVKTSNITKLDNGSNIEGK